MVITNDKVHGIMAGHTDLDTPSFDDKAWLNEWVVRAIAHSITFDAHNQRVGSLTPLCGRVGLTDIRCSEESANREKRLDSEA